MPIISRSATPRLLRALLGSALLAASPITHALDVGDPVRFAVMTTDDQFKSIGDYEGKLLIVHFWATWHEPSIRQLQTLRAVLDHTGPRGVAMLGICLDADDDTADTTPLGSQSNALAVLDETLPDAADPQNLWQHAFAQSQMPALDTRFFNRPYAIPAVWIVAPDGTALWQGHPADLPEQLDAFLDSHPPTDLPAPLVLDETTDADATQDQADASDTPEPTPDNDADALLAQAAAAQAQFGQEIDASAAIAAEADAAASAERALDHLLAADAAWNADPAQLQDALLALASIEPAAHDDPMVAAHAQRWQRVLEAMDDERRAAFIEARDTVPEAGFALDALLVATADVDPMQGQPTADPARITSRVERALRDVGRGRHAEAYKAFSSIVNIAAGLPEADDALIGALRYAADETLMQEIAIAEADAKAKAMLFLAKGHAEGFREEQAAEVLQQLLDEYPQTPTAAESQTLLESLDLPE